MADCLASEATAPAADYAETAIRILEEIGARNDLAKAMVTKAALRQRAGDVNGARRLLDKARETFQALGTLDGMVGVRSAIAALDRAGQIPLLAGYRDQASV